MAKTCFISHATEDKTAVARPLAAALGRLGWDVFLDEADLTVGDSLTRHIDAELAKAAFGVVVVSPSFISPRKRWTVYELEELAKRQAKTRDKVLLPVWHDLKPAELQSKAPRFADLVASQTTGGPQTSAGIQDVAESLNRAIARDLQARLADRPLDEVYKVDWKTWQWRGRLVGPPTEVYAFVYQALRDSVPVLALMSLKQPAPGQLRVDLESNVETLAVDLVGDAHGALVTATLSCFFFPLPAKLLRGHYGRLLTRFAESLARTGRLTNL
jgi:hypothetical protein